MDNRGDAFTKAQLHPYRNEIRFGEGKRKGPLEGGLQSDTDKGEKSDPESDDDGVPGQNLRGSGFLFHDAA